MMLWLLFTLTFGGYISDKFHYFRTMIISCILIIILAIPSFYMIQIDPGPNNSPWNQIFSQFILAVAIGGFGGPMQIMMIDSVDNVTVRYCVMGIAYNLNQAIFGGTAPAIATSLSLKSSIYVGLYLTCVVIMSGSLLLWRYKHPNQAAKGYLGIK